MTIVIIDVKAVILRRVFCVGEAGKALLTRGLGLDRNQVVIVAAMNICEGDPVAGTIALLNRNNCIDP